MKINLINMIRPFQKHKTSKNTNLELSLLHQLEIQINILAQIDSIFLSKQKILLNMGQTCSACQAKNISLQQIKAVQEENRSAAPNPKPTSQKLQPSAKEPLNDKQCQENKRGENRKEVSVLTSKINQTRAYEKMGNFSIKLESMPDYSNEIVKQKKQQFGPFQFNKAQLQVQSAQTMGPLEFEKRYVYQGQWKNNERNGRGVQQWKDGSIYQGYWKNNVAFGYGRLIHADGDVYIGQWLNDRASGKGRYFSSCGAKYDGDWKDDKQDGYGEQTWPDQAIYKGEYMNGKKHGKGTFLWQDDSCYEGQFVENNIHGFGKYIWKDGRAYQGEWKNNKMDGKGIFTWLDGRRYEGEYKNDKKEGFGIFHFRDGRIYQGQWKNGRQHGKGLLRKKNLVREGIWQDGDRVKWVQDKQNEQMATSNKQQNG